MIMCDNYCDLMYIALIWTWINIYLGWLPTHFLNQAVTWFMEMHTSVVIQQKNVETEPWSKWSVVLVSRVVHAP